MADMPGGDSELRARLAAKVEEADALRAQIEEARLRNQQLGLQLRAAGLGDGSLVPASLRTGGGGGGGGGAESQHQEFRSMLQWLVECVDLERHVVFECGAGDGCIQVGGRCVRLQRMASWPLVVASRTAGLKLSVPLDMQADIAELLAAARARGRLDEPQVQRLVDAWEMVGAEVASAQAVCPEPAVFLIHRGSTQAMIVGQWPGISFAPKSAPRSMPFDPAKHFRRLEEGAEECRQDSCKPRRPPVCTGDRVEVEYRGQWFPGRLQGVKDDFANVQCDVDSPGIITVAPLASVRPAGSVPRAERKKLPRHMRFHSMG